MRDAFGQIPLSPSWTWPAGVHAKLIIRCLIFGSIDPGIAMQDEITLEILPEDPSNAENISATRRQGDAGRPSLSSISRDELPITRHRAPPPRKELPGALA